MMSAPLLVSVCIANYNGMDVIDDCIRSVQAQLGDIAVEILVHDDVSTDASVSHIQEHYPQAKLIISESNVGFCIANNRMAALAQGQYLLLLNNDAALYPDALQELLAEANNIGKPAILTLPQYDATTGVMVDRGCLLDPFFNPVPNLDPKRVEVAMVIGACLWVPKDLWKELEGFPEWFGSIAEDMYLCCRARLAGYAVRALSVSGYRHWQGKSFGGGKAAAGRLQTTIRRRALSERNKTFVMILSNPIFLLTALLPLHLVVLNLEGLVLSVLTQNWQVWRQVYAPLLKDIWCNRGALKQLRQSVQTMRRAPLLDWLGAFVMYPRKVALLIKYKMPEIR
jgi:GT2 family glycosyltransferase